MTDLEKSMRTDLGKKDLIVDRKNCQRTSPKSVNFGQFFFQPLILYGKATDFGLHSLKVGPKTPFLGPTFKETYF